MIIRVLATMMIWSWLIAIFVNLGWPYDKRDWLVGLAITITAAWLTALAWWL